MNSTIRILGEEYVVHSVELLEPEDFGHVAYKSHEIYIDKRLSIQEWNETLAHEISHIIAWRLGYNTNDELFIEQAAV